LLEGKAESQPQPKQPQTTPTKPKKIK
jgi:hypothetical protein